MSTIKINDTMARQFGPSPYGNQSALTFAFVTSSAGAVSNSDSTTAAAIADVVDLGQLPAGFRMDDSVVIISDAFTASATAKLGFKYEDGTDDTTVPQDDDYFGAGLALDAAARLRNATSNKPVNLPKPARLILTLAGAALAEAGRLDVVITGELTGAK